MVNFKTYTDRYKDVDWEALSREPVGAYRNAVSLRLMADRVMGGMSADELANAFHRKPSWVREHLHRMSNHLQFLSWTGDLPLIRKDSESLARL